MIRKRRERKSIYEGSLLRSETQPLAGTTIARRDLAEPDVQMDILFCGICHSDLHQVRYSPMRHWGVTKGRKICVVGLGDWATWP